MAAIYKREFKSYFQSMIGFVFIAFLLAFTGIYFMIYNLNMGYPYFSYTLSGSMFVFMIAVPVLTMKSFAEERKSKTDQLLLTAPVSLTKVVLGKYLAIISVYAIPCLIFCIFPLIIKSQGNAHLRVDYLSILVFYLLGCVYIAIGMFLSALTESQIIAAISTFGVLLLLNLWGGLLDFLPTKASGGALGLVIILTLIVLCIYQMTKNWIISAVIEAAGVIACAAVYFLKSSLLENVLTKLLGSIGLTDVFSYVSFNNILDLGGLVLYLSLIGIFIFLTMQAIQKRRWS